MTDKAKASINLDPLKGLEDAAKQLLIDDLTGIKTDLDAITSNSSNPFLVQEKVADITGKLVALQVQLPALLPLAQGALTAIVSNNLSALLGDVIEKINANLNPPAPAAAVEKKASKK